jgi:hypothetical protein
LRSVFESAENHTGTHSAAVRAMSDSEAETSKSSQITTVADRKPTNTAAERTWHNRFFGLGDEAV